MMVWIIVISLIVLSLALKIGMKLRKSQMHQRVLHALENNYSQEISERDGWEDTFRTELAKTQLLLDNGDITDEEYLLQSEFLLERYREIEQKYHGTDTRGIHDYPDYLNSPYYDY